MLNNTMSKKPRVIIFFSTADYHTKYLTNKQHEALILSKMGFTIIYINSLGLRKFNLASKEDFYRIVLKFFDFFKKIKKINNKLFVFNFLLIPIFNNKFFNFINYCLFWFKLYPFLFFKKIKISDVIIWSYHPLALNFWKKNHYYKLIYRSVDELSAIPNLQLNNFKKIEDSFVKKSDFIFTTNYNLLKKFKKNNKNVFFHSNVVDFNHFKKKNMKQKKIAIYHGLLSDYKINFKFFYRVIKKCKEVEFWIVGTERQGQKNLYLKKIIKLTNVKYFGYVPYELLPNLLAKCSIGLLPLNINKYTKNMSPMKYYEYISSGLRVISTEIEFFKNIKKNSHTYLNNDYLKFSNLIKTVIKFKPVDIKNIRTIVADNTWEKRTKKILDIMAKKISLYN